MDVNIYRIPVHPIALGKGKPLFENLKNRLNLKLIKKNVINSGVVQKPVDKIISPGYLRRHFNAPAEDPGVDLFYSKCLINHG